ncbi:response regulator transcription factor [Ramlibacter sp. G-1-2-2]|uniref:Response regulator transcription factor n=1 Tax=Ramlibacter agri TaxID=2728837 RepID=A0A848H6Q4_9BURK|nr:response regulator transcription factor [Ramlibacter agri]NML44243.1 response regulator transcription factor [Ramlibacter agri]
MPTGPTLLLVDDHALFRTGLAMVLASAIPDVRVNEAASIQDAMRQEGEAPDLVLLDIQLQGLNGLDGIGLVQRRWPGVPVLMLSSHTEPEKVRQALARGAADYLSKAHTADQMIAAITRALRGEAVPLPAGEANDSGHCGLTPRQFEVLDLLCQGLSNKAIGRRLNLSEHTVRGHVQATLAVLDVSSRSEAAFAARQRGLVH